MKHIKKLIIVLLFIIFPCIIYGLELNCDNDIVNIGDTISCTINSDSEVTSIEASLGVSSNLELLSSNFISNINSTISLKALSSGSATITLKNITLNEESVSDITKNITIQNSSIGLDSLSIKNESISPSFSSNITDYTLTTSSSSIEILATSSSGEVTGVGTKSLKSGSNTFEVVVKNGSLEKTYTLTVNKVDKGELALDSLEVSGGNIDFDPNTLEYYLDVDSEEVTITATADSDINIKYSPSQTIKLEEGKKKKVSIILTQNKMEKTYVVNITYVKDDEEASDNNNLKSVTIDKINFKFNSKKTEYSLSVENDVDQINIEYETEDSNAKTKMYGNTKLKEGNNTIKIVVTSESNEEKTYTFNIIRNKSRLVLYNDEDAIIEELSKEDTTDDIYIELSKNDIKEVSSNILSSLKGKERNLIYDVKKSDNEILYELILYGKNIKNTDLFEFGLSYISPNDDKLLDLFKDNKYISINFKTENELPGKISLKLYIGDTILKNEKKLVLYKYNVNTNELEKIDNNIKNDSGYITISVDSNDEYIIRTKEEIGINQNILIPAILIPALIIIIIVCIIVKKRKLKK